jgi:hypothetical protein
MDVRAEREAQITAGDLQASHRVSAASPNPPATMEDIGTALVTALNDILDEMERMHVTLGQLIAAVGRK